MNPEFSDIVQPSRLQQSPVQDTVMYPDQSRTLRPPGGIAPPGRHSTGQMKPPAPRGLQQPSGRLRAPSGVPVRMTQTKGLAPLSAGLRPPTVTGTLRAPGRSPPVEQHPERVSAPRTLRIPQQSTRLKPPGGGPVTERIPSPQKVIPLPGSPDKLAAIPKPTRLAGGFAAPAGKSKLNTPGVERSASSTLLPKPAFMQPPPARRLGPPIGHSEPQRTSPRRAEPPSPFPMQRPSTAPVSPKTDRLQRPETAPLDMGGFREKYGVTQSPKMRQLLEVTGEWNREILERPTMVEPSPGGAALRAKLELARQEKMRQRVEVENEYQRLLEERANNAASRRPYAKQERGNIRMRYQKALSSSYIAPTEEELDDASRMVDIMKLEEAGILMTGSPEKTAEALFPEAIPTAEITGVVGDNLIPAEIPVEEINTINSMDRSTAEVALKASLVSAPAKDAAKQILEDSLQDMATTSIQPMPQILDSMYEIDLMLNQPKRQNVTQLQGSSHPSWFPGFHSIFPGPPGLMQATKSPSSALATAWRKIKSSITSAI